MYALRHKIFKERLNWDVIGAHPGLEFDKFDDMDPVYGVCVHMAPTGMPNVLGCWRLLPTTGPYMLKDIFPVLLHGQEAEAHETIWEISRFAVTDDVASEDAAGSTVSEATRLLLNELFRFGISMRIRRYVACSDIRFQRVLKMAGVNVGVYGPPMSIGNTIAVGGWADVTDQQKSQFEQYITGVAA